MSNDDQKRVDNIGGTGTGTGTYAHTAAGDLNPLPPNAAAGLNHSRSSARAVVHAANEAAASAANLRPEFDFDFLQDTDATSGAMPDELFQKKEFKVEISSEIVHLMRNKASFFDPEQIKRTLAGMRMAMFALRGEAGKKVLTNKASATSRLRKLESESMEGLEVSTKDKHEREIIKVFIKTWDRAIHNKKQREAVEDLKRQSEETALMLEGGERLRRHRDEQAQQRQHKRRKHEEKIVRKYYPDFETYAEDQTDIEDQGTTPSARTGRARVLADDDDAAEGAGAEQQQEQQKGGGSHRAIPTAAAGRDNGGDTSAGMGDGSASDDDQPGAAPSQPGQPN